MREKREHRYSIFGHVCRSHRLHETRVVRMCPGDLNRHPIHDPS